MKSSDLNPIRNPRTEQSGSNPTAAVKRSPKIRRLFERHPSVLYTCGYIAILFCLAVLFFVFLLLKHRHFWMTR